MGFGALRSIIRPLSKTLLSRASPANLTTSFFAASPAPIPGTRFGIGHSVHRQTPWFPLPNHFHSLTDTRLPKRRPVDKSRRKRSSLKPPGPYAWVQYVPGQPISPNNPNEGSVKARNAKKRIRLHRAFVLSEKKKRMALLKEANRKKKIKSVERKMAAVARERAWVERLKELQRLEEKKKASVA